MVKDPITARPQRGASSWLALLLPLVLLLTWQVTTSVTRVFLPHQLPSPWQVVTTAWELAQDGELSRHVVASLGRILAGFVIGAGAAILVGTLVGLSQAVEIMVDPTLQLVRNVPSLAWVPFLLLWLGIGEAPKITLIAIGAFFPVYLNLLTGIRQTDRKLIEVGYVFGMGRVDLVWRIILLSAFPYLLTGLRIGIGQSWLFLVAAELIASTRGLGFLLIDGQNTARPNIMLVGILVLAGFGKLSDAVLRCIERRVLHWTDGFEGRERR
ncbi:MAG TPA: ABC transporter permease [Kofleriaceae bacterium]|nr:ABC transporter permease [Kofleriaceae bacterium]